METTLKPHNQIELPQEVCRRLELLPGIRLTINVDGDIGAIILIPQTRKLNHLRAGSSKHHPLEPMAHAK